MRRMNDIARKGSRAGSPGGVARTCSCTREFRDLGGEDQVLRALRSLVREGRLVRLGYGVYGRAVVSRLSGDPILYSPSGFLGAARQALDKLGVKWEPTEAERDYNEGRSTQVPVNPVVRVRGRFRAASVTACGASRLSDKPSLQDLLEVQKHFDLPSPLLSRRTGMSSGRLRRSCSDAEPFRLVFSGGTALGRAHVSSSACPRTSI